MKIRMRLLLVGFVLMLLPVWAEVPLKQIVSADDPMSLILPYLIPLKADYTLPDWGVQKKGPEIPSVRWQTPGIVMGDEWFSRKGQALGWRKSSRVFYGSPRRRRIKTSPLARGFSRLVNLPILRGSGEII